MDNEWMKGVQWAEMQHCKADISLLLAKEAISEGEFYQGAMDYYAHRLASENEARAQVNLNLSCCNALGHRAEIVDAIQQAFQQGALWSKAKAGVWNAIELDEASKRALPAGII